MVILLTQHCVKQSLDLPTLPLPTDPIRTLHALSPNICDQEDYLRSVFLNLLLQFNYETLDLAVKACWNKHFSTRLSVSIVHTTPGL